MAVNIGLNVLRKLKLVQGGDLYQYTVGEARTPDALPRLCIKVSGDGPVAHQAYVRQWEVDISIDVAKKSDGIFEAMAFCNRLAENPDALLDSGGIGITNVIAYPFVDAGNIVSDSIYRIEQKFEIIEEI